MELQISDDDVKSWTDFVTMLNLFVLPRVEEVSRSLTS